MTDKQDALERLADYLWKKKDDILKDWKDAAQQTEEHFSSLAALSRKKFYDNMPEFLDNVCKVLRCEENKIKKISKKHGAQRWQLNFDLRELMEEWGILHSILINQINRSPDVISISYETLNEAQQEVARIIYQGIKKSVAEFYRMQRMEAQAQIADLETILREHNQQARLQGHNLRQASHDLGGSVALIQMNLHLLKRQDLPEEAAELVEQLSGSAENLVKLFKSLLDLFRLEAGDEKLEVSEFDAAELMRKLNENMQSLAAERNIRLHAKGDKSLPVQGDWIKVRRIAQNLVMNSLKYTKEGQVEINWGRAPDNHWELIISDTGPGLGPKVAALFSSTDEELPPEKKTEEDQKAEKNNNQGEGIGLSIVRRLCELLDAIVELETNGSKGTRFRIVFPVDYAAKKNSE